MENQEQPQKGINLRHIPYKWVALSNTTLGIFMAMLDGSIVLISLPAIFRRLIRLPPVSSPHSPHLRKPRWIGPSLYVSESSLDPPASRVNASPAA